MRTGGKYQFKTAEDLWRAAQDYFKWCDNNPIIEAECNGRICMHPRPYTFTGLCLHLNIRNWTLLVAKNKDREGFEDVFDLISTAIWVNLINGAMVGIYSEKLVARLVGVPDKVAAQKCPPATIIATRGEVGNE